MSLSYFNVKKLRRQSKQAEPTESLTSPPETAVLSPPAPAVTTPTEEPAASPMLDDEDQKFLERLTAISQEPEGTPPPLPNRPVDVVVVDGEKKVGKDAQEAIMDGAHTVPLPTSPPEVPAEDGVKGKDKAKKSVMSYFALAQNRFKKVTDKTDKPAKDKKEDSKDKGKITGKDKNKAADDLHTAAEAAKSAEQKEAQKEQQDIAAILDDLNLSAVNNRVFSFSKESEELFAKFKLVLKDIISGAPTAYNDLEKLFTEYDTQLKKMYGGLPPFLQNLVKSLPAKLTATLGPEIMAAQAEKPGFDAKQRAGGTKSRRPKIPSLKSLISAEGAVATMLKSILNFLKLRFPAVLTGTNVVMSLAVCILLFVFWYCHKRGRETRLEKGRLAAEADSAGASDASLTDDADSVFGDAKSPKADGSKGESSKANAKDDEKSQPPLIISDGKDSELEKQGVTVNDMPSVKDLPEPGAQKE